MSRHFWRARDREGGFTFVELLVTIIIAGLAFVAMVPVFVGTSQASSGDIVRNAALQLAQDKLEKIRGLDYDMITAPRLTDNTVPGGQFGTTVNWTTGGGGTRTYHVSYQVAYIDKSGNAGATPGQEAYKQVTVIAYWDAPPNPVKPVTLSTMISKQYAGPQILRFNIGPTNVLQTTGNTTVIVGGPVQLDAWIAAEDIASMNQGAIEENRGYVLFTVTPLSGGAVSSQKVTVPVSGEPAHYLFTWDNAVAPDDFYILQAVAVAGFGSRAQGPPASLALQYTNHMPAPPTDLTALAGDASVLLNWNSSPAGDLAHYEIWRSSDGGITYVQIGATFGVETSFYDQGVVGGIANGTAYYYKVRTVDTETLTGPFTDSIRATPYLPGDNTPPSLPTNFTASVVTGQPTVHLSWTASTDGGTPASGLAGYIIERWHAGLADWVPLQSQYQATVYDDTTAGWATTWTYRVRAIDLAGNQSGDVTAGPVTTDPAPLRSIAVTNDSTTQTYVWVQSVGNSEWYTTAGVGSITRPSGEWVKKNGTTTTWSDLPIGIYNVFFLSSSTWNEANILRTVAIDVSSGNGTALHQ